MKKNVIVGQSGGPTAVINASLAGVYKTAKDMGADAYTENCIEAVELAKTFVV